MAEILGVLVFVGCVGCGSVVDSGHPPDGHPPDAPLPQTDAPVDTAAPPDPDLFVDLDARMGVMLDGSSKVTAWLDQSGKHNDASAPATPALTVTSAFAAINGVSRPVLRFDGASYLIAPPTLPAAGTVFVLYANGTVNGRVIGWENFATGSNGLGIDSGQGTNKLEVIARRAGASGDIVASSSATTFELDVVSWGTSGVTLERYKPNVATEVKENAALTAVGDGGYKLHVGSSGDQAGLFHGDLALLRVYSRQMSASDRMATAAALMP